MIICKANLGNPTEIENLCKCCTILGVEPTVSGGEVSVSFENELGKADTIIGLFEQYHNHEIKIA